MGMFRYAIKILIGDRAKYIGIIIGLTFASFIITQQTAIFLGVMARTYGFIADTSQPNIWVMDKKVQFIDDAKPLKDTQLFQVRGVEGVGWAVPFYKGLLKTRLHNGNFQICNVLGIDDATLIGGPPKMIEGRIEDLRRIDSIIVNQEGAEGMLASIEPWSQGKKVPLEVGAVVEINDHRAEVVGICETTPTFQSQPVIYTTFNRATTFAPRERKLLSFILVHSAEGFTPEEVCQRIESATGLAAYTAEQFTDLTIDYYMTNTGIPINFGVSVLLGFVIGTAVAGQTFYNFTLDNLRFLGTFKAMGAPNRLLTRMVLLQALMVGGIGWGLGVGGASIFGWLSEGSELAFKLPWSLFLLSGLSVLFIVIFSAILSLWKVYKLEPAIVFKS